MGRLRRTKEPSLKRQSRHCNNIDLEDRGFAPYRFFTIFPGLALSQAIYIAHIITISSLTSQLRPPYQVPMLQSHSLRLLTISHSYTHICFSRFAQFLHFHDHAQ